MVHYEDRPTMKEEVAMKAPESQMKLVMSTQDDLLCDLAKTIDVLIAKLNPITSESGIADCNGEERMNLVPLASHIRSNNDFITSKVDELRDLTRRIEL